MVTVEDFSRLVSGIYAAAVTPGDWPETLREIHCTLDGILGGLLMVDGAAWSLDNSTLPAGAAQSYAEYYYRLDRVLAAVERGPAGAVRTGSELMPLVRKSEFYEDWLRPLDIDDGLFVRLTGGPRAASLIIAAPRRSGSFETPERMKLMSALVPHFQQALRTQDKLEALADSAVEMAGALNVVRHGIVIVAGQQQVMSLNSAAERILRADDGLCMRSGRIAATHVHAEHRLCCGIHNALTGGVFSVREGHSFTCVRPSGRRPYVIHVLPSHRCDADGPLRSPMATVLIIDPEDNSEPAPALLRRLYRLTNAEADIALQLMQGGDLKQIAEELSISLTTVRTHLHHVFDKTGTHRQVELVRLLLALSP